MYGNIPRNPIAVTFAASFMLHIYHPTKTYKLKLTPYIFASISYLFFHKSLVAKYYLLMGL